jgi:hypothetical protein
MNNTRRENVTIAAPLIFTVPAYGFVMALYLDRLRRTPTRERFPLTCDGSRRGPGRKTESGRKSITIYIKEEIIRTLEPGARTKLRQWIENNFMTAQNCTIWHTHSL